MASLLMRVSWWAVVALLVLAVPASADSSCSADCANCQGPAPNCTATCSGLTSAHCQSGECGGLKVGCCCVGVGGFLCKSVPGGNRVHNVTGVAAPWALLEYVTDPEGNVVTVEARFASSSAVASGLIRELKHRETLKPLVDGHTTAAAEMAGPRPPGASGRHETFLSFIFEPLAARGKSRSGRAPRTLRSGLAFGPQRLPS